MLITYPPRPSIPDPDPDPDPHPDQGRSANREAALLELCAGLFDERLAAAEPQRAQAVLQARCPVVVGRD